MLGGMVPPSSGPPVQGTGDAPGGGVPPAQDEAEKIFILVLELTNPDQVRAPVRVQHGDACAEGQALSRGAGSARALRPCETRS